MDVAEVAQSVEQRTENPLHMARSLEYLRGCAMRNVYGPAAIIEAVSKVSPDKVQEVMNELDKIPTRDRTPIKRETPPGGITIRGAGRKYRVNDRTIGNWVKRGLIPVLLETSNEKFIDETIAAEVIKRYKEEPGRGKRTALANN